MTPDDRAPRYRDRADVVWVRPRAPVAVAAVGAAVVLAALGWWVLTGVLPGPVADVLLAVGILLVLRDRGLIAAADRTADTAVVVGCFAWCVALACGVVVSVQRAVWVDGSPVAWWVHILVALGILAVMGAVTWAAVLLCFLVSEDTGFLGGAWGALHGAVVAFVLLWSGHVTVWWGMLGGAAAAVVVGPVVTALLRVRLVWLPRMPPGHPG